MDINHYNKIINIYAESIDYQRLKTQMQNEDWENYLKQKYKDFKFDKQHFLDFIYTKIT